MWAQILRQVPPTRPWLPTPHSPEQRHGHHRIPRGTPPPHGPRATPIKLVSLGARQPLPGQTGAGRRCPPGSALGTRGPSSSPGAGREGVPGWARSPFVDMHSANISQGQRAGPNRPPDAFPRGNQNDPQPVSLWLHPVDLPLPPGPRHGPQPSVVLNLGSWGSFSHLCSLSGMGRLRYLVTRQRPWATRPAAALGAGSRETWPRAPC